MAAPGLVARFGAVVNSAATGYEKPHLEAFRLALEAMTDFVRSALCKSGFGVRIVERFVRGLTIDQCEASAESGVSIAALPMLRDRYVNEVVELTSKPRRVERTLRGFADAELERRVRGEGAAGPVAEALDKTQAAEGEEQGQLLGEDASDLQRRDEEVGL